MRSLVQAVITTLLFSASHDPVEKEHIINVDNIPQNPVDATAWSLIYTYPLAIFANFAGAVLQRVDVNEISHQHTLATPTDAGVIKPNVDTLYSRVVLDLSSHDVVLTVPAVTDGRYWLYPVYDLYGNVIAEIGLVNGNKPGNYLIRYANNPSSGGLGDLSHPDLGSIGPGLATFEGVVNLPTTYGTMLVRYLLLHNSTDDLEAVHAYQNASRLTPLARQDSSSNYAPSLSSLAPKDGFLGIDTPIKQLDLAARLVPYNLPTTYSERYRVSNILAAAGLNSGKFHHSPAVDLNEAALIANASITADVQSPDHIRDQGNSWQLAIPAYQGNYGTHYAAAAYVALYGYQQLTTRQTLYPGHDVLGFTTYFHLEPNESALFTFSGKPRLRQTGFWSLTVYGSDQYLVPNELNRYEVGDRNYNLTYEDGGLVYGPDADPVQDGPFQVLLQPADTRPPSNWTGNWLPVAREFSIIVRWYTPEDAMTNGSYVYPKVEYISSIV